jgi:tetratricopeptide (TPR) repeat protein|tara:strand:+ start:680 stop:1180 length:501 start_codon:yes stop_codon:yes gene_type:complete
MKSESQRNQKATFLMAFINTPLILILLLSILCGSVWGGEETPLQLPKAEGSKSFDLEIDQINSRGMKAYQNGAYEQARAYFGKASSLAKQLRDPSQGVLHYNLALSLHQLDNHEEAIKQFYFARRFARGNKKILDSKLLELHECGLNPSVPCDKKIPLKMNIEGSH